ncbi:HVO_0476 family zinc finger protein [Archaeoglobus veneficus]|uniref:Archaeal Zn-finger protein n=1 Tax=Archaeoglobus veneficus (strain DSM 11195 / SNP6) TaxID=693661 RepID=F2KP45_ARCVS|nr:HVO_0476 family zinc finger protein [Archaeoglobus veneficus]AEA46353.1 hypothetical protein Arcve_0319 [Archaeoglobus veneficus SNP6]
MYLYCDTCKEETEHEVVRAEKYLYRCRECGTVAQHLPEKMLRVKAIISSGAESEVGSITLKESDIVEKGDELVVEVEEGFKIGEVTSLELGNGKRSEIGEAKDIQTVWLRDVGEVILRISLHKGPVTTPYKMTVSGETEFGIGEVLNVDGKNFRITRMKLIDGRLLKKAGERAKAKEIKRIYAMYEGRLGRRR